MAYEKIDVGGFLKKLKGGDYNDPTGARRAVGRMSTWTPEQRASANASVNKHFGVTDAKKTEKVAKPKTTKATKPAKPKKSTATAKAKKSARGKRPAAKKGATGAKAKTAAAPTPAPETAPAEVVRGRSKKSAKQAKSVEVPQIPDDQDTKTIKKVYSVLDGIQRAKQLGTPDSESARAASRATQALYLVVDKITRELELPVKTAPTEEEKRAAAAFVKAARVSNPVNGVGLPAQLDFESSM